MIELQTVRVYDTDPTVTEIESKVLQCLPVREGIALILEKTCFFPGGGGQNPDRGTVDGQRVLHIKEEKGIVYHIVEKPIEAGKTVKVKTDSQKRRDDIEVHSGEHILSGTALKLFGVKNVGFHMGKDFNTADFDNILSCEQIAYLEMEVNRIIRNNTPINVTYPSEAELETMPLRKRPDTDEPLRVVEIVGADVCACCGTHGKRSGDVGLLRIIASEGLRGGTRLSFLCGRKACEYTIEEHDVASEAAKLFSTGVKELPERIRSEQQKLSEIKTQKSKIENLLAEETVARLDKGGKLLEEHLPFDMEILKKIAERLTKKPDRAVFLYGNGVYVLMKHETSEVDLLQKNNELKANGAKGGGRDLFFSGRLS